MRELHASEIQFISGGATATSTPTTKTSPLKVLLMLVFGIPAVLESVILLTLFPNLAM
jgi:hypothetical protein